MSLLDAPLSTVDAKHVAAFLAGVSGESLTWEGKGTDPLPKLKHEIRRQVCAFANQLGGLLILGATQETKGGPWSLPGVERGTLDEDPHDWISRVIADGLRQAPPFEVRCLDHAGRLIALVRVAAAAEPPCMTIDGIAYQRVVGQTLKITDPRVLADLLARGERARAVAEATALAAQEAAWERHNHDYRYVALGMSPTYRDPAGATARLFTAAYSELVRRVAERLPLADVEEKRKPLIRQLVDGWYLTCGAVTTGGCWQWRIRVRWDWSVSVRFWEFRGAERDIDADEIIEAAWSAAAELLRGFVLSEDASRISAHVAIRLTGQELFHIELPDHGPRPVADAGRSLQRWTTLSGASRDELTSVSRELLRAGGLELFEP